MNLDRLLHKCIGIQGLEVAGNEQAISSYQFTTGSAYVFRYDSVTKTWVEEVKLAA